MATNIGESPAARGRLLLIEHERRSLKPMQEALCGQSQSLPEIALAPDGKAGAEALRRDSFDLVVVDLDSIRDFGGDEAMARLVKLADGALVIALSDEGSVSATLLAMRAGAHDCLPKPLNGVSFVRRIGELADRHGKTIAVASEPAPPPRMDFAGFVGGSSAMQAVYEQIRRIAPSSAPVFVTGESGTGKDVCARALHSIGPRRRQPLVVVNCATPGRDTLERELFGDTAAHAGGGAAERAHGGTLFLDEVGELDLALQGRLLRLLQTGSPTSEGASQSAPLDVRLICATKEPVTQLIEARRLREDLFYRLHVLPIHLPPLRQRPSDVLPLALHFLQRYAGQEGKHFSGFAMEAIAVLGGAEWPGNVRQLENLMRRIAVTANGGVVTADMVRSAGSAWSVAGLDVTTHAGRRQAVQPMWQQEQRIIEDAIASFGGNVSLAAAALEISPSTIYRKRQGWAELDVAS